MSRTEKKKMSPKTKKTLSRVTNVSGMALAVIPPVVAFITQFPSELTPRTYDRAASWFAVAMLVICCIPFFKKIKEYLKSPDAFALWTAAYIIFAAIERIAEGIVVVAFVGMISNIAAKGLFVGSKKLAEAAKSDGEKQSAGSET